jgi:VIT1/CCC1 family predicted Fe2+/Mn2+ transporter
MGGGGSRESWRSEKESAFLYRVMAAVEGDGRKQVLFTRLAVEAEQQAALWEKTIREQGLEPEDFRPSRRAHVAAWLLRRLGPRRLLPMLAAMKVRGISVYRFLPAAHPRPDGKGPEPGWHRGAASGATLRAAVFGLSDGLVSNTSLVLGMAGASGDAHVVLLAGSAGLLAGAFSMAAGEYVSMRSQRELFEHQIGLEREELELYPEEEAEELSLIYQARGVAEPEAKSMASALLRDKEHALDALAREELGLNPGELGSPWGAAASSFLSFGAGALLPLLPFFFAAEDGAVRAAAILGLGGLFLAGSALSLFTGRGALWSGLRMALIGAAAAGATYGIGRWLGVKLS